MVRVKNSVYKNLDSRNERKAYELLNAYLNRIGQRNAEQNTRDLMSLEKNFEGRFQFFVPLISKNAKESILISGCAVGSEHLAARSFGFKKIYGTEVAREYVKIAKMRLKNISGCFVDLYDGKNLPYSDGYFSCVYSGHIIEHTPNPFEYFAEHFRVLRSGGYFYLEFPIRYHWKELHTGVVSFEWMPIYLRKLVLSFLSSRYSVLTKRAKLAYHDVLETLQPVSVWQIRQYLRNLSNGTSSIIAVQKPAPGIVRILIKK